MELQVLGNKNFAPQLFDVLPLKDVSLPFDRGRKIYPVGINCKIRVQLKKLPLWSIIDNSAIDFLTL